MVPRTVLTKSGPILLNTAQTKRTVNGAKPMPYFSKTAYSSVKRPINQKTSFKNSNCDKRVNTVRFNNVTTTRPKAVVSAAKRNPVNTVLRNEVYVVKASACWVWRPKQNVIYHVFRHNSVSITLKRLNYINAQGKFKTMDMKIDQQVALDEALIPHAHRLRIGRSNFRLLSDISSKESTLQLVYDVLRQTPFFKAFLVTTDVLEIYMQEFWATATVYHHSIMFKMDNKKHIVNLESFREMLHICPRLPDFAYLLWEDFVYQVEHKDTKKRNEMYYPRDDQMFMKIKLVSRHQNTQQFGAILPIELTNADIRNSDAYKEYYAVAIGAAPPKTKASVRLTKSSSETTVTPPPTAAAGTRLFTFTKGKQPATTSKAKSLTGLSKMKKLVLYQGDDGDDDEEGNDDDDDAQDDDDDQENANKDDDEEGDDDDDQEEGSDDEQASDEEGKEFIHPSLSTHDEEETRDEETLTSVNPDGQQHSSSVSSQFVTSMLNPTP
nr:hypothetical protein [Tanacetum cinerariifolium]